MGIYPEGPESVVEVEYNNFRQRQRIDECGGEVCAVGRKI